MASLITTVSSAHKYCERAEIDFYVNDQGSLNVTIDTGRVHIRSVTDSKSDCDHYVALFGDEKVMRTYATGQTKTKADIETRIKDSWVKRWRQNDPYTALVCFKKDTDDFLGHVVLGHGDLPGESELAYLFHRAHWNQGFGTEIVTPLVREYAPATVAEGYTLEGKPLERIVATARADNLYSSRILEKVGMKVTGEEVKYGAKRQHFAIDLSELVKK